jgi:guanyl-specific ribonuclease Sa
MSRIKKYLSYVIALLLLFVPMGLLSACGGSVAETYESQVTEAVTDNEAQLESDTSHSNVAINELEQPQTIQNETEQSELEQSELEQSETVQSDTAQVQAIDEAGTYTTKEDVALYIHTYGHLPDNFITKKEAEKLGWNGGSLEPYASGKCIGGSRFGNYEGILPEKDGRTYTECDIDTLGSDKRGAKRIVFSNDGLIYYTEDHYTTFELLYGEE